MTKILLIINFILSLLVLLAMIFLPFFSIMGLDTHLLEYSFDWTQGSEGSTRIVYAAFTSSACVVINMLLCATAYFKHYRFCYPLIKGVTLIALISFIVAMPIGKGISYGAYISLCGLVLAFLSSLLIKSSKKRR